MLVVAMTGYLFVTNLRVNRTAIVSSDTAALVEQRVDEVNDLQADVNKLSSEISTLTGLTSTADSSPASTDDPGAGTILPAVEGSGVSVTLDDSPMWEQAIDSSGSSEDIDKYVIHQQDIESVINALWAGGAEAMTFMDQRILFNSAVICSGNVVALHGRKYSPPFTISAIGDPDRLIEALDDSKAITIYQQYVSAFGLGWKVERKKELHFDETAALLQPLKYAKPVEGWNEETPEADAAASDADTATGDAGTDGADATDEGTQDTTSDTTEGE